MYLVIFICLFLGSIIVFIFLQNARLSKLEKEREEGKWDYIDREFLPYLNSHPQEVKSTRELDIKYSVGSRYSNYEGRLHYNAAGLFIEKTAPLSPGDFTEEEFIQGKDKPSKFSPLFVSFFHSLEKRESNIILNAKSKASDSASAYQLTIKSAPNGLFEDLQEALAPHTS